MHRFPSTRALVRLRLGSFLFLLLFTSLLLLIPAIIWGLTMSEEGDLKYAIILLAIAFISGFGYLLLGSGVRCPLCHGPVIGLTRASRNRKAARTLGSYRFAVALRVIFLGRFRCPNCGEPCKCETRH